MNAGAPDNDEMLAGLDVDVGICVFRQAYTDTEFAIRLVGQMTRRQSNDQLAIVEEKPDVAI